MDKKTEYAEMLEIPVNTCNVSYKPSKDKKKRKLVKLEEAKEKLLKQINENLEKDLVKSAEKDPSDVVPNSGEEGVLSDSFSEVNIEKGKVIKEKKERGGFGIIGVQLAVIVLLVAVIVVSNVFWADSGINRLMRTVFSIGESQTEPVEYNKYSVDLSDIGSAIDLKDGVMTFNYSGSLYSPIDGTVTKLTEEAGKYVIEISHNSKFKTVIKGADYAYCSIGEKVFKNVPIGYSVDDEIEMCFYNQNQLVTDFDIQDNQVVWQV